MGRGVEVVTMAVDRALHKSVVLWLNSSGFALSNWLCVSSAPIVIFMVLVSWALFVWDPENSMYSDLAIQDFRGFTY